MSETTKVLIIDDSEDDRLLYRRALAKGEAPYDVAEAEDGEGGLRSVKQSAPDCVLLDYSLPGRNGIEVLKRMRAEHPFVPVVMLTGQGNEAIAVAAIQAGAQNYISKATISTETLQRAIRVAIEHCAMQRRIDDQRSSLEIFTRALAHDLKEPVRTMRSFLDLLIAHESVSEKGSGYVKHMRSAAERMGALIDGVFHFTKLDSSAQELAKANVEVGAVLADVKESIAELVRERRATVTSAALPAVRANRVQLNQILQNLIVNAIRHSPGEPHVHIDATEDGDRWQLRVTDNGPGIEEAQRGKIFEPFKRLTTKGGGLGLGLAICKRIVELHGGKIWVEGAASGGAAFCFTLPKASVGAEPVAAKAAEVQHTAAAPAEPQGTLANVLIVDDSEADLELTRIMLVDEGHMRCNLHVARGAQEALALIADKLRDAGLDLILLDINMPGVDGFELLKKLREQEALRDLPVVMCTTSGYDKDMEQAKALGASGYVTKPADLTKLRPTLAGMPSLRLAQHKAGYALVRAA